MIDQYSLTKVINSPEPEKWADHIAYYVEAMIATSRLALDNETTGGELAANCGQSVERTLEVAQALARLVGEGCEVLEKQRSVRSRDAA